jgi:bifunctional DNA-binding transcriptional regulator/antitoxin component of YhaV-PrlF toxin-antitoxin module
MKNILNSTKMEEPKFIAKVRVTKQGQITLPQEARTDLKIDLGSEVYWYELNHSLIILTELVNQKELVDKVFIKNTKGKNKNKSS